MYYNPGCWMRYLALEGGTLDNFKDEKRYPYWLDYVSIETGVNKEG